MDKVTFIDTQRDETHVVTDPDIGLSDSGIHACKVHFHRSGEFPDAARGLSQSAPQQWEIVVTADGQTVSGSIRRVSGLTVTFTKSR